MPRPPWTFRHSGEPTYYELLQVSPNASPGVIKAAHKARMLEVHPDVDKGSAAANEHTAHLNEARDVLLDPDRRSAYDGFLTTWRHGAEPDREPPARPCPRLEPDFVDFGSIVLGTSAKSRIRVIDPCSSARDIEEGPPDWWRLEGWKSGPPGSGELGSFDLVVTPTATGVHRGTQMMLVNGVELPLDFTCRVEPIPETAPHTTVGAASTRGASGAATSATTTGHVPPSPSPPAHSPSGPTWWRERSSAGKAALVAGAVVAIALIANLGAPDDGASSPPNAGSVPAPSTPTPDPVDDESNPAVTVETTVPNPPFDGQSLYVGLLETLSMGEKVTIGELVEGDCLVTTGEADRPFLKVQCQLPHDRNLIRILSDLFPEDREYPGPASVQEFAEDACEGGPDWVVVAPSREQYEAGDRDVRCFYAKEGLFLTGDDKTTEYPDVDGYRDLLESLALGRWVPRSDLEPGDCFLSDQPLGSQIARGDFNGVRNRHFVDRVDRAFVLPDCHWPHEGEVLESGRHPLAPAFYDWEALGSADPCTRFPRGSGAGIEVTSGLSPEVSVDVLLPTVAAWEEEGDYAYSCFLAPGVTWLSFILGGHEEIVGESLASFMR